MKIYNVHEAIRVRADCRQGKFQPLQFQRGVRKYRVTAIHTSWIDREGVFPLIHFAVEARASAGPRRVRCTSARKSCPGISTGWQSEGREVSERSRPGSGG